MPCISVIIPCYNAANALSQTLAMLAAQSFQDWEAVCINDGSTDATAEILSNAAQHDPRIRVVTQTNAGPAIARNLGARIARGSILAFLDADDLWPSDRLAKVWSRMDGRNAPDAIFGKTLFFTETPEHARTSSTVPARPLQIEDLLGENPVCTMSNLSVRASAFSRTCGFDSRMAHAEDLEWLIRLTGTGAIIVGDDAILTYYRTSTGGLSANLDAMHHGWQRAVRTACQLDPWITAQQVRDAEAIHLRYLGRRALRTGAPPRVARDLVWSALRCSARAFFSNPRRGVLILAGSILAPFMPQAMRRAAFSN